MPQNPWILRHFVPGVGLEPTRPKRPQDFKSCVSTNSTIRAYLLIKQYSALTEFSIPIKIIPQNIKICNYTDSALNAIMHVVLNKKRAKDGTQAQPA